LPSPILLDAETAAAALPRAVRAGARWRPNTALASVGDHDVTVIDVLAATFETIADVDALVIRTHGVADDRLYHELRGLVDQVIRVGDAVAVRPADRAIYDGHLAGRSV